MDFIKFLISYFLDGTDDSNSNANFNLQDLLSSFGNIFNNNFNLQGILNYLPNILNLFKTNIKSDSVKTESLDAFKPIINIADKEIISSLNQYFSSI